MHRILSMDLNSVAATLCFCTFINMRINIKGVVFRIDGAVSIKHLTQSQRSVVAINELICKITYSQVLEIGILKKQTKRKQKTSFNGVKLELNRRCHVIKQRFQYPVDNVVNVLIHISFGIKGKASVPVILVSFEKQIPECHQIFILESHHHFITQSKRHQLFGNGEKQSLTGKKQVAPDLCTHSHVTKGLPG